MVSVRLVHATANKKGALIVVVDTSQTINKQMFVIDAITESLVSHILMFATIADHDQALVFWLC